MPTWLGNAVDQADICTCQLTGVWAAGDTATFTINHNDLVVTVGTPFTTTDVAALIVACWNASARVSGTTGSCNQAGQLIGEFREIIASSSGDTITFTTRDTTDVGKPFQAYLTRTEVTVGTGALGAITSVQAATGKNWWNNVDNWSGNAVPTAGQIVTLADSSVPIKYGLPVVVGNLQVNVYQYQSFTGTVGLPPVNADNALTYAEYRPLAPVLTDGAGPANSTWKFGLGDGTGSRFQNWTFTGAVGVLAAEVFQTGGQQSGGTVGQPDLTITSNGAASGTAEVLKGRVRLVQSWTAINVGFQGNQSSDVNLTIDNLDNACTISVAGGTVLMRNGDSGSGLTFEMYAGAVTMQDVAADSPTIHVIGGVLFYNSTNTIDTLTIDDGATADFSTDRRAITVTDSVLNGRAVLKDPTKRITYTNATTGVDLSLVDWQAGPGRSVKVS